MKNEFQFYDKSKNISNRYALNTVSPTIVEGEHVFSTSNKFVALLRNILADKSINALVFLKYYFPRHEL